MTKILTSALVALALSGCAALVNTAPIDVNKEKAEAAKTYAPVITSMTANPTNTTTGQPITFDVKATDPNNQQIQYAWSTPQGVISSSMGQTVSWTPPAQKGVYPIQVVITNLEGKSTSGTLNVIVDDGGQVTVGATPAATESL